MHKNNFNLIRLLAALQVLIVHGLNHFELEGPGLAFFKAIPGVPTFFLISGFLIGASYLRSGPSKLGYFFRNRALRIYPALWVCVLLSTLAMMATGYLATQSVTPVGFAGWIAGQVTVVQFYNPGFMRQFGTGVLNGALWTIAVELQFYVLMPVLAYLLQARRWLFGLLMVASLATNLLLRLDPETDTMARKLLSVTFLPWVYMFMLGLVAAAFPSLVARARALPYLLLVPAYLASMLLIGSYMVNATNAIHPLSVLLLGMLLLKVGLAPVALPAWLRRLVENSDFSYGLYLYHMPVINILLYTAVFTPLASFGLTLLISAAVAVLSWFLIEQPALQRKHATPVTLS